MAFETEAFELRLHALVRHPDVGAEYLLNADEGLIEKKIVNPWLRGTPIVLGGAQFPPAESRVRIIQGRAVPEGGAYSRSDLWRIAKEHARDVTDRFIREPAGSAQAPSSPPEPTGDPRKVMVIHGRDAEARDAMFQLLRALSLNPLEWSSLVAETRTGTPYVGEVLDKAFAIARAAVVLLTPDEEVRLRPALQGQGDLAAPSLQARPNVFYEAGLAFGRFPERTIVVEAGEMREASDLGGRHAIRVRPGVEWRHDLADRLQTAGCDVDKSGRDWLSVGSFEGALDAALDAASPVTETRSEGDQKRLDALFRVLSRPAIRRIREEDFAAPWPDELTYPVDVFLNEMEGLEHEFDDSELEHRRVELRAAATAFVSAETHDGFPAERGDWRNTGWTSLELETDPKAYEVASARGLRIREAAHAFVDAHDALVRTAKGAGYDLDAIDAPAPRPPWRTDPNAGAA
jgi:predicted nucleotide-binding protein